VVCIRKKTTRDFTLDKYRELCLTLQANGYTPLTVRDYLNSTSADSPNRETKTVIIRHDVDRKIMNALRMAKLEHEMGIHATYYFRYPYTFKPDIIREIQELGHEIGYHYEVLRKVRGDYQKAIKLFESELGEFRKISTVDTICMHWSPLSEFNNRDIWNTYNFRDYGITGEAYLSIQNVFYFTDTGRSWGSENNLRDRSEDFLYVKGLKKTDELGEFISAKFSPKIYLVTHPERWAHNTQDQIIGAVRDYVLNWGKKLLRFQRK